MPPKKKEIGKALVRWDEKFADLAKETAKGVTLSQGKFINFSGGRMSYAGADIPDDKLRCVVIGWVHHNIFYEPGVRYDPNNPQSPICYSFGREKEEMEPLDSVPEKQCDQCATCPLNAFGSADNGKGKGKACQNTIRLAVIAESDLNDLENAEIAYMKVPTTSAKNWEVYLAKKLRDGVSRPHWSVITLVKRVPDDKSQFKIEFSMEDLIEDSDLFEPLESLWMEEKEAIEFPYAVFENKAPPPKKAAAKNQKFAKR